MIQALIEWADNVLVWLTPKTTRLADPRVPTDYERARVLFERAADRRPDHTTDQEIQP